MGFLSAVLECVAETTEEKRELKDPGDVVTSAITSARSISAELADKLKAPCPSELSLCCSPTRRRKLSQLINEAGEASKSLDSSDGPLFDDFTTAKKRFERVDSLVECFDNMLMADRLFERRRYREAAELYERVHSSLNGTFQKDDLADASSRLKQIATLKRAKCVRTVTQRWRDRLQWTVEEGHLEFRVDVSDPDDMQEVLNSLFVTGHVNVEVSRIADFFIDTVFPKIMSYRCTVKTERQATYMKLTILTVDDEPDIGSALDNLTIVFETVQSTIDCRWEDDRSVFSVLGQLIGERFFRLLADKVEKALVSDLDPKITSSIEKLNNFLCEICFTYENTSPLPQLGRFTTETFHDKRCETLLNISRQIMKRDLRDGTVEVFPFTNSINSDADEFKMPELEMSDETLLKDSFTTSKYVVSESVKKLTDLILNELEKAQDLPVKMSNKTINAVKNVLEMYCTMVPRCHKDALQSNPQTLALFYNNCHYMAYTMVKYPWIKILSKDFARRMNIQIIPNVYNLRISAVLKFSAMLRDQQQFIETSISNSDLPNLDVQSITECEGETIINKCLERFKYLKNCWQSILSEDTYEKAMLELIDCLCRVLVDIILTVKDKTLDEDAAHDIADLYKTVIDVAPTFFSPKTDVKKESRHFGRFHELISVLGTPMFAIATDWRSKDGELSAHFTCEEVKHLVRIMFPGSPQKSAVLDMIQ